jgi:hypothetical protein
MEPGNGTARVCFRGGGAALGGSGYATDPKGAAMEPRCDCEYCLTHSLACSQVMEVGRTVFAARALLVM